MAQLSGKLFMDKVKSGDTNSVRTLLANTPQSAPQSVPQSVLQHIRDDALVVAASKGFTDICKLLVSSKVNTLNKALIAASKNGYIETVTYLLSVGANSIASSLYKASESGYTSILRILYSNVGVLTDKDIGESLFIASRNGLIDTVTFFLTNVNVSEKYIDESIEIAASFGYTDVVKALIPYASKVGIRKAMSESIKEDYNDISSMLLDYIENVSSILRKVIKIRNLELVKAIIDKYNLANDAVQYASAYGSIDILKYMLDNYDINGSSINIGLLNSVNEVGKVKNTKVVELLLQHGADNINSALSIAKRLKVNRKLKMKLINLLNTYR